MVSGFSMWSLFYYQIRQNDCNYRWGSDLEAAKNSEIRRNEFRIGQIQPDYITGVPSPTKSIDCM